MPRGVNRYDEARLQGQLWTPALMRGKGLVRWFDAMDTATITCDGSGNVSAVADKSFLSSGISQPTAGSRPAYDLTFLGQLSFRASAGGKSLPYDGSILANTNYTVWMLFYSEASSGQIFGGTTQNTNQNLLAVFGTTGIQVNQYGNDLSVTLAMTPTGRTGLVLLTTQNPSPTNGTQRFIEAHHLSDVPQRVVDSTAGASSAQLTSYTGAQLMANTFGSLTGGMCEFIAINYSAGQSERQRVQGYLAAKWGVQDRLDGGHPFKNRPPLIGD